MHSADKQEGFWSETPPEDAGRGPRSGSGTQAPHAASGDAAAADFLGLDQDITQLAPDSGAGAAGSAPDASNSWLLSLEGEHPELGASSSAPVDEGALEPADAEVQLEPEFSAEADAPAPPAVRRSRAPLYALAATVVVAAGGWFAWDWWQSRGAESEKGTQIVVAPKPARPAPMPKAQPAPLATNPPVDAPLASAPEPGTNPAPATEPAPAPASATPETAFEFGARPSDGRVREFLEAHTGGADTDGLSTSRRVQALPPLAADGNGFELPVARTPGVSAPVASTAVPAPETVEPAPDTGRRVTGSGRTALRIATEADLAGIWNESTVPHDAINAGARLVTPQVGRVRLAFHDGELFEGRLYAVGHGQVWLDTELGRTALDSYRIARIDRLSSADGTPALGTKGSAELAGLPRMRVRTPGGMLYGRVIDRDERTVTIVTEAGARITIETNEVEPAPEGRSLIVRGYAKPGTP